MKPSRCSRVISFMVLMIRDAHGSTCDNDPRTFPEAKVVLVAERYPPFTMTLE